TFVIAACTYCWDIQLLRQTSDLAAARSVIAHLSPVRRSGQPANRSHAWPARGGLRAFAPCPRCRWRPPAASQCGTVGESFFPLSGAGTPPTARLGVGTVPHCAPLASSSAAASCSWVCDPQG